MEQKSTAYAKGYAQGQKVPAFISRHGRTIWDTSIALNKAVGVGLVATGVVFCSKALALSGACSLASAAVMDGCKKMHRR